MRAIILFFFISLEFSLQSQPCIILDVHDTSCGQSNGWANVYLNCCGPLEQVNWSTGATGATINNLAVGAYSVSITTLPGCVEEFNFNIAPSDGLLGGFSIQHNTCGQLNNGQISIFTPPAYPDMTYTWNNGATGNAIYALSSGIYTVIAHTSCGDGTSQTFSFEVLDWSPALTGEIIPLNTRCNLNNGAATVIASGGGDGHTYQWSNGQTTAAIANLSPGTYTVTVNSNDQCTPVILSAVINPSSALVATTEITHTKCGLNNGIIDAYPTGNTYTWSNGGTLSYIDNLSPGAYSVTVTDGDGCTSSSNGVVNPSSPLVSTINIIDTKCGLSNGIIDAYPTGNTYTWSNGGTLSYIDNLSPGVYSVTVTDGDGCTARSEGFVNPSDALNTNLSITPNDVVSLQDNAVYQWINCNTNQPIVGATQQSFIPTANGSYAVELWNGFSAPDDCYAVSDCIEWIISGTADQNQNQDIIIPTVVSHDCNIEIKNMTDPITITLISPNGSIISTNEYRQPNIQIKMNELPSGMYFIKYSFQHTSKTTKVLKM